MSLAQIGPVNSPLVVELIGVPFDLCSARQGSRLGPGAARLAGLAGAFASLDEAFADAGDVSVLNGDADDAGIRHFEPALSVYRQTKGKVAAATRKGAIPLVVGGDHSNSMGSVSGALETFGEKLAVLWVDAHADLNTPKTSPSGNLHGMPMAALLGLPSGIEGKGQDQWDRLLSQIVPARRLLPDQAAWFGLRDVDPGERNHYQKLQGEYTATMYDIDRHGLVPNLERLDAWLRKSGAERLWISFDVDALDPILAPGTGTAVRGGLSYREMHLMGELLHEFLAAPNCPYALAGLDVMEINPLFDTNNETARTAVEWIGSLFGKTILGKR